MSLLKTHLLFWLFLATLNCSASEHESSPIHLSFNIRFMQCLKKGKNRRGVRLAMHAANHLRFNFSQAQASTALFEGANELVILDDERVLPSIEAEKLLRECHQSVTGIAAFK